MKRALKIAAVLGIAGLLATAVLHAPARGRDQDIKQLMGNNFGQLQRILVNLIRSDYRTLPHDVEIRRCPKLSWKWVAA